MTSKEEFDAFLSEADDKLVFLSVVNGDECDLGDYPDAQDVQRTVSDDAHDPCVKISNTLTRVARECSDAVFLTLEADSSSEMMALAEELGVTRFPTFQVRHHINVHEAQHDLRCSLIRTEVFLSKCRHDQFGRLIYMVS